MGKERIKPIAKMQGRYFVSDQGRVYSLFKNDVLATELNRGGYLRVFLRIDGRYVRKAVHRLVAEAFLPPASVDCVVNHIDGNKQNNRSSNLEYTSRQGNVHHAMKLGLRKAKLSRSQAEEIKALRGTATQREIAARYGVTHQAVSLIHNGKSWGW